MYPNKIWCNNRRNIWRHFGRKTQCKKEAKNRPNLEVKIGIYLEVKHGAKWDAKVVKQMDVVLDANLDENME